MNSIEYAIQKILSIIAKSKLPEDLPHAQNTLEWLLKLESKADLSLQLAALAHDIDRADGKTKVERSDYKDYDSFKYAHAHHGAEILRRILEECKVEQSIIEESCRLVCLHEIGGDRRSNLLMYADSISFFEINLLYYYQREGWQETLRRSIWGYKRLPQKMKEFVKKMSYNDDALTNLLGKTIRQTAQSNLGLSDE